MHRLYNRPKSIFTSLFLVAALLSTPGCFLDFDEFELEGQPGDGDNAGPGDGDGNGPGDGDGPGEGDNDGDNDGDSDGSDPGEPRAFGSVCESDDECISEVCRGTVCLDHCEEDLDCPDSAGCFQIGTERLCAPHCLDSYTCNHIDYRDDFSCVVLVQTEEVGHAPHRIERACLTDRDEDGVFDGIDNCPDTINPTQRDSSADSVGDACSATPFCHLESIDGILDYPTTSFRAGEFTIPYHVRSRYVPVVGTIDEAGRPESSLLLLDRHTQEWVQRSPLQFTGSGRHLVESNDGGYFLTPGERSNGVPLGSWLKIDGAEGEISTRGIYQNISNTFGPYYRFPSGEILRNVVFLNPGFPVQFLISRYNGLTFAGNLGFGSQALDNFSPNLRWEPLEHMNGSTSLVGYSPSGQELYLLSTHAPLTGSSVPDRFQISTLTIPTSWIEPGEEDGNGEEGNGEDAPEPEDLSGFDPLLVSAPGGQLYVFDRTTGRAGRFIAERTNDFAPFRFQWTGFERTPEYDLEGLNDFESFSVYRIPEAMGIGVIGRPLDQPDTLLAREIYLACLPGVNSRDSTGDGVADLFDNCPLVENPDQEDLDQDFYGDACDPDIDGDGIGNAFDLTTEVVEETDPETGEPILVTVEVDLSRDSTNNGIPNDNEIDVDNDLLADQIDPFPFDSSNNGVRNLWTVDANGTGFLDSHLRNFGVSPFYPFSVLASKEFLYIADNDNGERTLYRASVAEPFSAEAISLPEGVEPHELSFGLDTNQVVFLAGPPGESDRFLVYSLDTGEVVINQQVNQALRSIRMIGENRFLAVHSAENEWRVFDITVDPNDPLAINRFTLYQGFPHIWFADLLDGRLFILAADHDCRECALLYRHDIDSGAYLIIGGQSVPSAETFSWGPFLSTTSIREDGRAQLSLQRSSATNPLTEILPLTSISSSSFSRVRPASSVFSPNNTSTPFYMVTGSRRGQPDGIWLGNPYAAPQFRWRPFLILEDRPIHEVRWIP